MKPFIRIALTTGHTYEIPTLVVAENRARVMLDLHTDEFKTIDESMIDTRELFDDAGEIRDWALNNMNPTDYMPSARLVRYTPPELDFSTAEWTYHDLPSVMAELDGEQVMRQPVEAVLTTMAASNQLCNVTVLNNSDGQAFAGLALFIGNENVIGAFASSLSFMADRLTAKPLDVAPASLIIQ